MLIWVGYLVQASPFIQVLDFTYAGYVVICCGAFLIFLSFVGLIGAWKQRKLLLGLFIVFNIVVGVLLICFGGVLIYLRTISDEYLENESTCLEKFPKANNVSAHAAEVYCTIYCPCSLDTEKVNFNLSSNSRGSAKNIMNCDPCETMETHTVEEQNDLIDWVNYTLGYTVNSTDCNILSEDYKKRYFTSKQLNYIPLITWIEEKFECSGLCTNQSLLMFSDVNNGEPNGACYDDLKAWANKNFINYGVISIVLGSFQLFVLSFASSLCCCPKAHILEPDKKIDETEPQAKAELKLKSRIDVTHDDSEVKTSQGSHYLDKIKKIELDDNNSHGFVKKTKIKTPFARKGFYN